MGMVRGVYDGKEGGGFQPGGGPTLYHAKLPLCQPVAYCHVGSSALNSDYESGCVKAHTTLYN